MAQRIDRDVHLGALLALVSVVAGPRATFWGALQSAPVEDGRRRLRRALGEPPQELAQIVRQGFETAGGNPPLDLLIDARRRRKIVRDHVPRTTHPHQVAHRVEDLAQRVRTLGSVLLHQGQIRSTERPLLIGHVAGISGLATAALVSLFGHPQLAA